MFLNSFLDRVTDKAVSALVSYKLLSYIKNKYNRVRIIGRWENGSGANFGVTFLFWWYGVLEHLGT